MHALVSQPLSLHHISREVFHVTCGCARVCVTAVRARRWSGACWQRTALHRRHYDTVMELTCAYSGCGGSSQPAGRRHWVAQVLAGSAQVLRLGMGSVGISLTSCAIERCLMRHMICSANIYAAVAHGNRARAVHHPATPAQQPGLENLTAVIHHKHTMLNITPGSLPAVFMRLASDAVLEISNEQPIC